MVDIPPEVYEIVRLVMYTCPVASRLNVVAVSCGIPFMRKHMVPVLVSNTVRPNAALRCHRGIDEWSMSYSLVHQNGRVLSRGGFDHQRSRTLLVRSIKHTSTTVDPCLD